MNSHTLHGALAAAHPLHPARPAAIERAILCLNDSRYPFMSMFDMVERGILVALLEYLRSRDVTGFIQVPLREMSRKLGVSRSTISRRIPNLIQYGWLHRFQEKSRDKGMQIAETTFTPLALQHLNLVDLTQLEHPEMPVPDESTPQPATSVSHGDTRRRVSQRDSLCMVSQSLTERQLAATLQDGSENLTAVEQPNSHREDNSVPDDLYVLHIAGITIPGIRKLMGMASDVGLRLGEVVEVAERSILKAKKPYSYVMRLLSSPTDWGKKLAALRNKELAQIEQAKQGGPEKDQAIIAQAMQRTGMITSYKRTHVWKLDDEGTVRKAEIAQLLADSTLTHWQPLLDTAGLAQAIGEGKLFAVDMQDLRDMQGNQGDGQHHEGEEGSQQDEQATPQPLCEPLQGLPMPTPVTAAEPPPAAPIAQPAPSTQPSTAQVKPTKQQQPQQPWHNLPQHRELDAIWAVAAQSPDGLLSNHKQAKVWKIIDGWLKVTTVQELLNTKTAIINWLPLSAEGVIDFANRLKQGQLFPVDRQTVQSWCPPPQPAPVQSAMRASTATANRPDGPSPQSTGTQSWRNSLTSLLHMAQGPFHGVGA